jgi:hypothetical protein
MAGLNQGLSNLVVKSFNRALEKKLPIIQSVGKLAKEQISVIGRIGQEVEFILEPEVSVGTYVEPIVYQSLNTPVVPIPVNRALDFAFRISDLQAKQLNALPNDKATELVTAAISNGIDKYNFAMEASMIALAPLAG